MPLSETLRNYWQQTPVRPANWRVFHFAFFFLVGLNQLLQIERASRFGVGDFNVCHVSILDALLPTPTRPLMVFAYLLSGYLALLLAFGGPSRLMTRLLAAVIGGAYFISQLDSFQHHYLVFLLVTIIAVGTPRDRGDPFPAWAIRLLLVQVAIVYLWTSVAKLNGGWLSGEAIAYQLPYESSLGKLVRMVALFSLETRFQLVAIGVVVAELSLFLLLLFRPVSWITFLIGVALHISIEFSGFEIGIFSYLMLGFYLLALPLDMTRFVAWLGAKKKKLPQWVWIPSALATLAVPLLSPLVQMWWLLPLAGVAYWYHRSGRLAIAHGLAVLTLIPMLSWSGTTRNYYHKWGGVARRTGTMQEREYVYEKLSQVDPDYGRSYYHLGTVSEWRASQATTADEKRRHLEDALSFYERAVLLNSKDSQAIRRITILRDRHN